MMQAPDWLTQRGASLKLGSDRTTWFVLFGVKPQYALVPRPAENRFECCTRQTINGELIPSTALYASSEEAVRGGLDELRKYLGWA
jgi:hypothetical protein